MSPSQKKPLNRTFITNDNGLPFIYAIGLDGYDISDQDDPDIKLREDSGKVASLVRKLNVSLRDSGKTPPDFSSLTVRIGFALKDGTGDISSMDNKADNPPKFTANPPLTQWEAGDDADGGEIIISAKGLKKISDTLSGFGLSKTESDTFVYLHELNHSSEFLLFSTGTGGRAKSGAWNDSWINSTSRKMLGETLSPEKNSIANTEHAQEKTDKWGEAYADTGAIVMMSAGKGREPLEKLGNAIQAWRDTCGTVRNTCDASHSVGDGVRYVLDRFPNGVPKDIKYKEIDNIARNAADFTVGIVAANETTNTPIDTLTQRITANHSPNATQKNSLTSPR